MCFSQLLEKLCSRVSLQKKALPSVIYISFPGGSWWNGMKKKLIKKKQPKLNSLFFFQYSPSVSLSPFCCLLIPPFCHFPPLGAIVHLMQSRTRLQAQAKFKPLLVTCLPLKYRQLAVKSQRIKPEDVMAETGFLIFIYLHIIACSCMFVNVSQLPHVLHPS